MALDGLMFDHSLFSPFAVLFAKAKASVRSQISDFLIVHEVVKGGVF